MRGDKKLRASLMAAFLCASQPAYAVFGIGDVTFDPTTYGAVVKQFEEMQKLYSTAKSQLDKISKIEQTIKDAQQAYETLSSADLRQSLTGYSSSPIRSAADLRAALAEMENRGTATAGFVQYQLSVIKQVEDLELLKKSSASNADEAAKAGTNTATNTAITAQSSATLATLAAAEASRKAREDAERAMLAKEAINGVSQAPGLYKAMGR